MKCDKLLEVIDVDKMGDVRSLSGQFYRRRDADNALAELNAQVNRLSNRANLWYYNAQNEHNAAVAVRLENAKLKHKLKKKESYIEDLKNLHYVDMMDLEMKNYKLEQQLRKQKIKRAEAMAEMLEHVCPITIRKANWKVKWHKRWQQIADKLKEEK